jgi:sn-glycerol 3-phosphate transport system permease protein
MLEKTPVLDLICHLILLLGAALVCLPLYFVFVTGTLSQEEVLVVPMSRLPSNQFFVNLATILEKASFGRQLLNSFVVALGVTVGKLSISIIAAFAVTYFRFPFRKTAFWLIFVSLMLPIEVRIVPTYESAANVALPLNVLSTWFDLSGLFSRIAGRDVEVGLDWNMVNTYPGLILPLIASATATFLFRQFFLTVPDELLEAALIDGARPMQFFRLILLPLSRSNIIALGIILFLAGWNQYLWPLLMTTDLQMSTAVVGLKKLLPPPDGLPSWHLLMNAALITMLPPALVILVLQRWFVKGLIDSGK